MKRLEDMSLEELWRLFPITLEEYNPKWADWARDEMALIGELAGSAALSLHHIGSTAVGGIMAKPIVDILAEANDEQSFAEVRRKLNDAGYICMSESDGRASFNKGYTTEGYAERVFHIHLRLSGDNDEVFFRDYLRAHPDVAKDYEALKIELARQYRFDRDAYTAAKTEFVQSVMAKEKADS